jgi:chorismate synthase
MTNTFGQSFKITTWGESHGPALGVVIDGCPAGLYLPEELIARELSRDIIDFSVSTRRNEPNDFEIMSGVYQNYTIGTPISIVIFNRDVDSTSYEPIRNKPRPGHGDLTWKLKYGTVDPRGGSRCSGRECVARLAAAAVARALLKGIGVSLQSSVVELAGVAISSEETKIEAFAKVRELGQRGDSTGGQIRVVAKGVPSGLGSPLFGKLQARIGQGMLSIGGVKSLDIGSGRELALKKGSESNDSIGMKNGVPFTLSNRCGGILGGISSGDDIVITLSVKPTPTHKIEQETIDILTGKTVSISCRGRHDLNFTPRVAVVAEAMLSLILVDEAISCQILPSVRIDGTLCKEGIEE